MPMPMPRVSRVENWSPGTILPRLQALGAGAGPFHHEALVPWQNRWEAGLHSQKGPEPGKKDALTPAKIRINQQRCSLTSKDGWLTNFEG
jgi:hypothetical protein